MGYLTMALRLKGEEHRAKVIDHALIDTTLQEIGKRYRPGLLSWIKEDRGQWQRLLNLEDGINQAALSGDEGALTKALTEYRAFYSEMAYEGQAQLQGGSTDENLLPFIT